MKDKTLFEECVEQFVTPEIDRQVNLSVGIANRLYDILSERQMSQKDFAKLVAKSEAEVSRWLMGTHNFTLATIAKIETALGEELLSVIVPCKPVILRMISQSDVSLSELSNETKRKNLIAA